MNKSTHFSGTPIIKQILKYLPKEEIVIAGFTGNHNNAHPVLSLSSPFQF